MAPPQSIVRTEGLLSHKRKGAPPPGPRARGERLPPRASYPSPPAPASATSNATFVAYGETPSIYNDYRYHRAVPPPQTQADAETRVAEGYECVDWHLCKRSL
jgi:hypothetical protein